MKNMMVFHDVKVQDANAMSSLSIVGFPPVRAFEGLTHNIERKLQNTQLKGFKVKSFGVSVKEFSLNAVESDRKLYLNYKAKPIIRNKKKKGKFTNASEFPEATCSMTTTLFLEYDFDKRIEENDVQMIQNLFFIQRIAGGMIINKPKVELFQIFDESSEKKFLRKLMLGYCIVERRDLAIEAMKNGKDACDAVLDFLRVYNTYSKDEEGNVSRSRGRRLRKGWIVPISTGFKGISDYFVSQSQRDMDVPHRLAESVTTLGQFIMPMKVDCVENVLWRRSVNGDLYVCEQVKAYVG